MGNKSLLKKLWPFGHGRKRMLSPIPSHLSMMEGLEDRVLMSAAPTFIGMIDGTQASWSNTGRSIVFYDVSSLPANYSQTQLFNQTPAFSVWLGYEDVTSRNQEDLQALAFNPFNGDAYVLAFDSGTPGTVEFNDTNGDYDLYHINFAKIYSDFITNHRAKGTMYAPSETSQGFNYFDEYGGATNGVSKPAVDSSFDGVPTGRSNTDTNASNDIVFIDGAISKVGEVARAGASGTTPFFDQQTLEFIDSDTLLLIENTTAASNNATGTLNQDYSIRTIERVSTRPGDATLGANDTGGYNHGTTESWVSVAWSGDNFVNMDNNAVTGAISDVDGIRYVERDGIRGVWVSDRDGGGDDLSFFYLDFNTHTVQKAEMRYQDPNGGGYVYATSFALDNDPAANDNQGTINWFNLDENGNLVISESGFTDTPQTESSIIRREIRNYNVGDSNGDGVLELTFGASTLSAKLAPTLTDDAGPVNGSYGVYVAGQNLVYYFDSDSAGPGAVGDVYVVDATTGAVVYQELNAANQFFRDANSIRSFTFGDFNRDGKVDSTDIDGLNKLVLDLANTSNTLFVNGRYTRAQALEMFDLDGNRGITQGDPFAVGSVNGDVDYLVRRILGTEYGDTNLDNVIDSNDAFATDLGALLGSGDPSFSGWAWGDFDGNGVVDSNDTFVLDIAALLNPNPVRV